MKKRGGVCLALLVFWAVYLGVACAAAGGQGVQRADASAGGQAVQTGLLQERCLAAARTAVRLEIERHRRWLAFRMNQGDEAGAAALRQSLAALEADLARYSAMSAADYVLPAAVETIAWVGEEPGENSVLYVEGMSRSGPWYHLAGVGGGGYEALPPNIKQKLRFYPVYPRSYGGMQSAYVYVDLPEGEKKIAGQVFLSSYGGSGDQLVPCKDYQVHLLQDLTPGAENKLILQSQQAAFSFVVSPEQLEQYAYLEFVAPEGARIIKLSEVGEGGLEIVLEREMALKKPAIYLYPREKLQVSVIHHFRGRLLNTYPAYRDGWTVEAAPDGTLVDLWDHRPYKYLFWDGAYAFGPAHYQFQDGFQVARKDYVSFLQGTLARIGLNESEINDFIVYWLPAMSKHQRCFVHFRINDDIDGSSTLVTTPAPETTIRVFMEFAGLAQENRAAALPVQKLPAFSRQGFTLVEWGGAEIGGGMLE